MKYGQMIRASRCLLFVILISVLLLHPNVGFSIALISVDKSTLASSSQNADYEPANAVDNNPSTRWGSEYSDDQWIYIDLGTMAYIEKVVLDWETAYGAEYEIQVSDDASIWSTVFTESEGDGNQDEIDGLDVEGRFVRMQGNARGTQWGYSLYEFEVYGTVDEGSSQDETESHEDSDAEKPGLDNTGYTGDLTTSDFQYAKTDGMVIEGLDLTGPVYVKANNVTIRNCRITGGTYGVQANFGKTGLLIEDCEITQSKSAGIFGNDFTARRVYIHNTGADGIKPGNDWVVEYSYITDMGSIEGAHADGVQMVSGSNGTLRYNTFEMPANTTGFENSQVILLKTDSGAIDDITIDNNWINGGGYSVQVRGTPTDITITNNRFGRDYNYWVIIADVDITWSGNTWEDSGEIIEH